MQEAEMAAESFMVRISGQVKQQVKGEMLFREAGVLKEGRLH